MAVWICGKCGYKTDSRCRPGKCPECGAKKDDFRSDKTETVKGGKCK